MSDVSDSDKTAPEGAPSAKGKAGYKTLVIAIVTAVLGVAVGIGIGAAIWANDASKASADTIVSGPFGGADNMALSETITRSQSNLYVVDAPSGYATKGENGAWTVTLPKGNSVLKFADRPDRDSAEITPEALVSTWDSQFPTSPPNGALLATFGPGTEDDKKVAITIPKAPTIDTAANTISFVLTPEIGAGGSSKASDMSWLSKLSKESAEKNGRVVLFVDSSSYTYNFNFYSRSPALKFTPSYGPSNCAVPQAIKFTGYYMGGTGWAQYQGSVYINDEGFSCAIESSDGYWNVENDGQYWGNVRVHSSMGRLYFICSREGERCGYDVKERVWVYWV